jgi:hypothetical protein
MIRLIQTVINRVKAMFTLDAMLDLEQQFLSRQAQRRAELFRTADRYQREGLTVIAADLRRQAETLSERRPLQTVFPFLESDPDRRPDVPSALALADDTGRQPNPMQPSRPDTVSRKRKKGNR